MEPCSSTNLFMKKNLKYITTELSSDEELIKIENVSDEEEGCVETQQISSDTEQEESSEDETYTEFKPIGNVVLARGDKTIKWKMRTPVYKNPTPLKTNYTPSVIGNARKAKSVLQCWAMIFTDNVLEHIVTSTNEYINSRKSNFARQRDCRPIDIIELKAFIAILYMSGFYRSSKLNLKDFWTTDSSGVEFFRLVMSIKRFYFLMQNINFDDINTHTERKSMDKLAPVREVFEMFVANCNSSYSVGDLVTIDKMLIKYKGKCPFLQYIPGKPNKYGIHIFTLVDIKTLYCLNLEIYLGEQPKGPYVVDYTPREVVKRLCTPLSESGRNVTGNTWFTSYELIKELQQCHQLTYVGSIKKNTFQLPGNFISSRGREINSSLFATSDNITLVSYIPAKRKNLLVMSNMHHDPVKIISTDTAKKPEILDFYDNTKCAVDLLDKLCSIYSVSRCANRWQMAVFYAMLNIGVVNSHIIYKGNSNSGFEKLRFFVKDLALNLAKDQIKRRSECINLPRELKRRATEVYEETCTDMDDMKKPKIEEVMIEQNPNVRKRCYFCNRAKNRLTRYTCERCKKYICLQHAKYVCENCNIKYE